MKLFLYTFTILFLLISSCSQKTTNNSGLSEDQLKEKANELAHKFILIDTHIDLPEKLEENWTDITKQTEEGHFNYPRAIAGGLDAAFMAIYIPARFEQSGGGKDQADKLIDIIEKITADNPDKFKIALSPSDVLANFENNIFSFPMGMENGTGLEGDIKNVKYFYDRGIRYITLVHSRNNRLCDSSYDEERQWNGLSPFGEEVVLEMNKLGIMVDVSHVSDSTFYDVIKISKAPVIASHSSCRFFTPGWERNMSDEMIKELAAFKGIIMINFGSDFIDGKVKENSSKHWDIIEAWLKENNLSWGDKEAQEYIKDYFSKNNPGEVTVSQVADHIDHVVKLVGVDYVGLGSDFDGVFFVPTGLSDVSMYPNLIYELLKRGYTEEDIEKICGKNLLRVWEHVEEISKALRLVGD